MVVTYAKLAVTNEAADKSLSRGRSFEDHWSMYMTSEERALFANLDEFVRLSRAQVQRMTR